MPSAVIKGFRILKDFCCHRSVKVSYGVTMRHIYLIFQLVYLAIFAFFDLFGVTV
jgi:hypothetical protein